MSMFELLAMISQELQWMASCMNNRQPDRLQGASLPHTDGCIAAAGAHISGASCNCIDAAAMAVRGVCDGNGRRHHGQALRLTKNWISVLTVYVSTSTQRRC
jgi:hypothetical protein